MSILQIGGLWMRQEDYFIVNGYMKAAELLYKGLPDYGSPPEVYPTLFLYRHVIELHLKLFYKIYIAKNDDEYGTFLKIVNHNLKKSFDIIKPKFETYSCGAIEKKFDEGTQNEIEITDIKELERIIDYFYNLDPTSFEFRYSTTKNGKKIREEAQKIDIKGIRDMVITFRNLLYFIEENLCYTTELESMMYEDLL